MNQVEIVMIAMVNEHPNAPMDASFCSVCGAADELDAIFSERTLKVFLQPIVSLQSLTSVGYEAIAEGPNGTSLAPDGTLYQCAIEAGQALQMEYKTMENSLNILHTLPSTHFLAVNVGPTLFVSKLFAEIANLCSYAAHQLVFILDLQVATQGLAEVNRRIQFIQQLGYRLVLKDSDGTQHPAVTPLKPSMLKISSGQLALGQDNESTQRRFDQLRRSHIAVYGSDIASQGQAKRLRQLGVEFGQGPAFGAPIAADQLTNHQSL